MLWFWCNYDINQPCFMLWNCIISGCAPQGKLGHFYTLLGSLWTISSGLCFTSNSFGPKLRVFCFHLKPTDFINQSQIFTFNGKSFPSQREPGKEFGGKRGGQWRQKGWLAVFFFPPHSLGWSLHLTSYTTVKAWVNCSAALTINKGCLTLSDLLLEL